MRNSSRAAKSSASSQETGLPRSSGEVRRSGEYCSGRKLLVRQQRKPFVTGCEGSPPNATTRPSSTWATTEQASGQSRLQTVLRSSLMAFCALYRTRHGPACALTSHATGAVHGRSDHRAGERAPGDAGAEGSTPVAGAHAPPACRSRGPHAWRVPAGGGALASRRPSQLQEGDRAKAGSLVDEG